MSAPAPLDPGDYIRGLVTARLEGHTWGTPPGHHELAVVTDGRGWCEACAGDAAAAAIAAGYGVEDVAAAFDRLVPPAHLETLRQAALAATTGPQGRSTLSRDEVLDARRRWQRGEGVDWRLAGVSKRTYIRARERYGLKPWPAQFQEKMPPAHPLT